MIDVFGTDRKLGAEAGLTRGCPGVTTGEALSSGLSVCKGGGKESADDIGPKREKKKRKKKYGVFPHSLVVLLRYLKIKNNGPQKAHFLLPQTRRQERI